MTRSRSAPASKVGRCEASDAAVPGLRAQIDPQSGRRGHPASRRRDHRRQPAVGPQGGYGQPERRSPGRRRAHLEPAGMVPDERHRHGHALAAVHRQPAPAGRRAAAAAGHHRRCGRRPGRTGSALEAAHRRRHGRAAAVDGHPAHRRRDAHVRAVRRRGEHRGRVRRPSGDRRRGEVAAAGRRRRRSVGAGGDRRSRRRLDQRPPLHLRSARPGSGHPDVRRAAAVRVSCCGRAPIPSTGSTRPTGPISGGSISCGRCATTPPGIAGSASSAGDRARAATTERRTSRWIWSPNT